MSINCKSCGAGLPDGVVVCPAAGRATQEQPAAPVAEIASFPSVPESPNTPAAHLSASFGGAPAPVDLNATAVPGAAPYGQAPQTPVVQQPYGQVPVAPSAAPYGQASMGQAPMAGQPYGQPGMPGIPMPGLSPYPIQKKFAPLAIVSFVLAMVSPFFATYILAGAGLVTGITCVSRFDSTTQRGRGLAIAGILIAAFWILFMIF